MNRVLLVVVGLMALTFLRAESSGCDASLVGDPTMDMWCGKTLCAWKLEAGKIQRVPTWHRSDYGVALVGDEVILSQLSSQGLHDTDCLEVRLQADHDDGVNLFIEMDFFDDKVVDHRQPFDSDKFQPVILHLRPPKILEGVRFIVRKAGQGAATLAEVKIKKVNLDQCSGGQTMTLTDLADGMPCTKAAECKGGSCGSIDQWPLWFDVARDVCSSCSTGGGACPGAKVCGLAWSGPTRYMHLGCVDKGAKALGERCGTKQECAGGICCKGVCSSCCAFSGDRCANGTCSELPSSQLGKDFLYTSRPHQCSPGAGLLTTGASCLRDADCASSSCKGSGPLKVCMMDGRTCKDDKGCPFENGKCLDLGQAGGLCQ